ncbi:MAG: outer membrane lipoprotein-sorting protein [Verrucomicrobiota bacterium]|mgnify:CR=1 FL=1
MNPRTAWTAVCLLVSGVAAAAATELSDAEIEGRDLARLLLEQRPTENFTNASVLKIRDAKGKRIEIPVECKTIVTETNWQSIYKATLNDNSNAPGAVKLTVLHDGLKPNQYEVVESFGLVDTMNRVKSLLGTATMIAFVHSDFWVADLGLEFFHWPAQKVLKHEMRRGQACKVLESRNPVPSTNGYSRVVSWIDNDSGGIVHAEAFDAKGKLLKEFNPKEFKKVNGQWQLQEMEIRNVQTGSRTRLEFDLRDR